MLGSKKGDIPELNDALKAPAWKIVWDLIIEGVLRPGDGQQKFELPFIQITDHGKKALQGIVNPYDSNGYLQYLKSQIPEIDPVIEMYIAEAVETLKRNCLLSSTVTLGCASEKAFLLLSEAFSETLSEEDRKVYNKKVEKERSVKRHHETFEEYLKKREAELKLWKTDWWSNCQRSISTIFPYFRSIRNDAGHPSGNSLSKNEVAAGLTTFPFYLRHVYDLIDWCNENSIVTDGDTVSQDQK